MKVEGEVPEQGVSRGVFTEGARTAQERKLNGTVSDRDIKHGTERRGFSETGKSPKKWPVFICLP